jgi:23S rRNA (guanosine2251-2'-O)-methyltransferase
MNITNLNTSDQKNLFIFGSEGKGISKNILSLCDNIFQINISRKMESLNVSNAVAATLAIVSLKKQIS